MAMQAAGLPLMDTGAAALAFGGVGGLGSLATGMPSMMMPGTSGIFSLKLIFLVLFRFF